MKKFRVFYTAEDDCFNVDVTKANGTEWMPYKKYPCLRREGANPKEENTDFIHYSIIMTIKDLLKLGYKWEGMYK